MKNSPTSKSEPSFERLTRNQRVQHIVLMASFFLLVITGFPVKYPETAASSGIIGFLGGFTMRAVLHRIGAVVLIGLTGYHICYTMFTRIGHFEFLALMPNKKDISDTFHMIKFYLGLASDRPRFDRYNYIEKFEYLAVGWGSVLMIATGIVLWFEGEAMLILPKWALDVARVIHSYEALLAFLAIIIWHFYHVHLNPDVFPMSKIWLTGKISEHDMKEDHPLEYERMIRDRNAAKKTAESEAER